MVVEDEEPGPVTHGDEGPDAEDTDQELKKKKKEARNRSSLWNHFQVVSTFQSGKVKTVKCRHCRWGSVSANATRCYNHWRKRHFVTGVDDEVEMPGDSSSSSTYAVVCYESKPNKQMRLEKFIDRRFPTTMQQRAEELLAAWQYSSSIPYNALESAWAGVS